MSSRDSILKAVQAAQPEKLPLPEVNITSTPKDPLLQFAEVLRGIGGAVIEVADKQAALHMLRDQFAGAGKVVHAQEDRAALSADSFDPHSLEDVDLAIVEANLGVAENGAIWVTDADLPQRVLPFITQHLAVLLPRQSIVPTMHLAYEKIGSADYGYGVFIAGPSKTADIEQSLVLGAHGARTMQVYLLEG